MKCKKCEKELDPFDDDTLAEMCWQHSPVNPANTGKDIFVYRDVVEKAIHDFVARSRMIEKPTILIMNYDFYYGLVEELMGKNNHAMLGPDFMMNPKFREFKIIRTINDVEKNEVKAY